MSAKQQMASKKKDKPLYDQYGRWVEERGRIKGALRKAFRLSPQMREVLQEARFELPPALKKDGTPGKRPQVRYRCAMCKELYPQKWVQVDHINTVVPLWETESKMKFDDWVSTISRNIFCKKDNLQVLCSTPMKHNDGAPSCHKKKTDEENYIRRELAKVINLKDHTGEEIDLMIENLKVEYKEYLKVKEQAKNERKRKARKR